MAHQLKGPLSRPVVSRLAGHFIKRRFLCIQHHFGSGCESERAFSRPGSDLLSRVLRRSTISAGAFHGRVRNGIGCSRSAITTRSAKRTLFEKLFLANSDEGVANRGYLSFASRSCSLVFFVPLRFFWSWRLSKRSFARSTDRRR